MEIEIKDDDDDIDYRGEKAPNLNNLDENQREPRRSDNNKARIIQNLYKKKKRSPHRSYIIVSEAESESDDVSRYTLFLINQDLDQGRKKCQRYPHFIIIMKMMWKTHSN